VRLSGHDHVGPILQWRDREPIGRFHAGLCGHERP
jgi:hypothetical protein